MPYRLQEWCLKIGKCDGFLFLWWSDVYGAAVTGVIFIAALSVFLSISW